jgi:3-dehydroquinate synthase
MELTVNLKDKSYPIIVERNARLTLRKHYDFTGKKALIVTDEGVPDIYALEVQMQLPEAYVVTLPQGEKSKSLENYVKLQKELLEHHFSRDDVVIAVGGGVIGDLAGFVASTYKRGIHFINIPTTSLSQIDSSIGGKTAIDFENTKNIIGTFYQPELVLVDLNVLNTLEDRQLNNGLVEALKMGICLDKKLYKIFQENKQYEKLDEVILKSIDAKRQVVEKDEKEENLRKVLNFGHTIGHPLESFFEMNGLLHGEGVASGMLFMIEDKALRAEVKSILTNLGIKVTNDFDRKKIMEYLVNDKKAGHNTIDIVLVNGIENYEIKKVTFKEVENILERKI